MDNYPVWFDDGNFSVILEHLSHKPNLRFLQIGVYTGDATWWLINNVLTHESSVLDDVDTWQGSNEPAHKSLDFSHIYDYYQERFRKAIADGKVVPHRMTSDDFFAANEQTYDFIYIDGDHHAENVLRDAANAWLCLKPLGILAFDDYLWKIDDDPANAPKQGIDTFLLQREGQFNIIIDNHQYWIQKL